MSPQQNSELHGGGSSCDLVRLPYQTLVSPLVEVLRQLSDSTASLHTETVVGDVRVVIVVMILVEVIARQQYLAHPNIPVGRKPRHVAVAVKTLVILENLL